MHCIVTRWRLARCRHSNLDRIEVYPVPIGRYKTFVRKTGNLIYAPFFLHHTDTQCSRITVIFNNCSNSTANSNITLFNCKFHQRLSRLDLPCCLCIYVATNKNCGRVGKISKSRFFEKKS